jgi:alkanesulfonate monooxygenase SsuD/methylene tetrahydromethanopterin reductase-like flavin-dependent oxidoreductase (luciferase family)
LRSETCLSAHARSQIERGLPGPGVCPAIRAPERNREFVLSHAQERTYLEADESTQKAADAFYPGYAKAMTDIGKERGWPPMTRASFDAQRGRSGALLVGSPEEVVDKIIRHSETLGGISRLSFMMNAASLPQVNMMRAIDAIGAQVAPALHQIDSVA